MKQNHSSPNHVELLERRRLMSGSLPAYANFAHTAGLEFNGYGSTAVTIHHAVRLTDGNTTEARSAFFTNVVNVSAFTTTFSFATTKSDASADGFAFVLQRVGPAAVGYDGHDLGYAGIKDSVGIGFNLYNFDLFGSQFGFLSKGKVPATNTLMGSIDLHNGDVFTCTLNYDGTTLSARVVDDEKPTDVFTASEAINIPAVIGGTTAYAGFTGATGVQASTQEITSWNYGNGPAIASLTALPSTVTKHLSTLTAAVTDPTGTKGLTYAWSLVSSPAGARAVTLSTSLSTADDTTVTVFSDGDYTFQVIVKDKNGNTAIDDVTIDKT